MRADCSEQHGPTWHDLLVPLIFLLLVLAVVAVIAALLSGRLEAHLSPSTSTRPLTGLPPGELEAADVEHVRFSVGLRGYRMDEVDDTLDRLRDEIARLHGEVETRDREIVRLTDSDGAGDPDREPLTDRGGDKAWRET